MYGISSITVDSQNMSSAVGITVSSCKEIEHLFLFGRRRRGGEKRRCGLRCHHPGEMGAEISVIVFDSVMLRSISLIWVVRRRDGAVEGGPAGREQHSQ